MRVRKSLMAVSAASASSIVAATIASAAVASTTVTSASASSAGKHIYHSLDFVIGGGAVFYHFAYESQVFACQAVIQVNDDFILFDFDNQTLEMISVFVDQRDVGSRIDVF